MRRFLAVSAVAASMLLVGCGSSGDDDTTTSPSGSDAASPSASATCTPDSLETLKPGELVIATGDPAFPPWAVDNDPTNGKGFEPAVAYAVAEQLGYTTDQVSWVRTTFDSAVAPGPKAFDFNIQQYTITPERAAVVDFSSGYFALAQTVVSYEGSPIADATSLADLKDARLGAAVGTTSLQAIESQIQPTDEAQVFNDNSAAVTALKNRQIDGIVVDLPTAFYLAGVEIPKGIIVGQMPGSASEELGLLLAKDSPLTACVTSAVDALRDDGTLASLETEWLAGGGAPVLTP